MSTEPARRGVNDRVRIKRTRSIRRVTEVRGDSVRLVTVEGTPLPKEGGLYEDAPPATTHPPPSNLRLRPEERFRLLSHVIDELPAGAGGELVRLVSAACFAVVRCMQGQATDTEARYAVERARAALLEASKTGS